MKKLFLLLAILALGSISAQGNGDFVSFQFVKTTPGEQYNVILNEKWKELHQMRIDEGTITGWDTWWRVGATPESDWNLLIVTVAKHPDSLNANVGVAKMRPEYSEMDREIFLEKIIEINPNNDSVVWEWRSVDHLIQDFDSIKPNYGKISEYPQKIDLNYNQIENGDLMHANGLYYDQKRNLILLSVNFYSEIWAIPHQYDTEVTKTEKGDLAFRFGNPNTFDSSDERIFFNNHHPNIVSLHPETLDNFLIYMNGSKNNQSAVYEFTFPPKFETDPKDWLQPELIWEFSDVDLFSAKLSGCIRLPNGNTLICEGDYGYWEVTKDKEVVWKYKGDTSFWRGYVYP